MTGTPAYTRQVQASVGGTVAGATEVDAMAAETGTNQAISVELVSAELGRAPGTYYVELRNTGTGAVRGIVKFVWEERQPTSPVLLET